MNASGMLIGGSERPNLKLYVVTRRTFRRWLLRNLQPCREMVPVMSESLERRLSLREWLTLRLHLYVCTWCYQYLNQIRFLRDLVNLPEVVDECAPALSEQSRARIATALKARSK
jgi:hypothetical protein